MRRRTATDWRTALLITVLVLAVVGSALLSWPRRVQPPSVVPPAPHFSAHARVPAELARAGELVQSEVQPDGTLMVTQWIRSRRPLSALVVSVHDTPLPSAVPSAEVVAVESPGGALLASEPTIGTSPTVLELRRSVRVVRVHYRLSGVVDRSSSVTGRALAGVTFLDVDYPDRSGPTTVEITGARILNLGCTGTAVDAQPRPCGAPDDGGWSVTLPAGSADDRVTAQLDLGQVAWASL